MQSLGHVQIRYNGVATAISGVIPCPVYMNFCYRSRSGKWAATPHDDKSFYHRPPEWHQAFRKPAPGMLQKAMMDAKVPPSEGVLFVGDRPEDESAALERDENSKRMAEIKKTMETLGV